MLRVVLAGSWLRIYGFKSHEPEQPSNPFQVDLFALSSQSRGHPPDAPAGMLYVLLVRDLNHQQVPCRFPAAFSVVEARTVQSQKLALSMHGEFCFSGFQSLATVKRDLAELLRFF